MASGERIDGWKAIGAYFGRDRTTAMRWAKDRGLPVRRLPGGKTATVYALKTELDRWASSQGDELAAPSAPETSPQTPPRKRPWLVPVLVIAVAAAAATGWTVWRTPPVVPAREAPIEMPADPAMARLYLQARDDWALRTPQGLERAIAGLETVSAGDPRFAPAFSALADAYLLAREFGSMPDAQAFEKARAAAESSLRLDPDLAAANRALGFIAYWWDNAPESAGRSFRRALELQPNSAQTHFWYGNVLSDNGQAEGALAELNRARLLEPGSVAIRTDLAWAEWEAGRSQSAIAALREIIRRNPDYMAAPDCLAIMLLAEGDHAGYVAAFGDYARLRDRADVTTHAQAMQRALDQGPVALKDLLYREGMDSAVDSIGRSHAWPAFVASVFNDRDSTLAALRQADQRRETWGSAGMTLRMRRIWANDAEILAGLDRRARPSAA